MDNSKFLNNLLAGKNGEKLLKTALLQRSFLIVETGQEKWLPGEIHEEIRSNQDLMSLSIRHIPDFLAYHVHLGLAYWDAKVKTTSDQSNFTLKSTFYNAMINRHFTGQRIVIAFLDTDGRWRVNWVEELVVIKKSSTADKPYVIIDKNSTHTLDLFLSVNTRMGRA